MDGQMDGRMDGWMDGRTDRSMDGWMDGSMDGSMDGRMHGLTNGRMNEWTNGWMLGCTDEETEVKDEEEKKEKDALLLLCVHLSISIHLLCFVELHSSIRPHLLNMIISASFARYVSNPSGICRAPDWRHDLRPGIAVRRYHSLEPA